MKKILLLLLVIILYNYGCKEKTTNPPDEQKPVGYQEDIPWPSLANSPWPMNHHDPQNTGRSPFVGPQFGVVDWLIDSIYINTSLAIDNNNIIYIPAANVFSTFINKGGLYAYYSNKELKWRSKFDDTNTYFIYNSPIISKDETIYFSANGSKIFYAIRNDGTVKWKLENINSDYTGINIGKDGTIYLFQRGNILTAINDSGKIAWIVTDPNFVGADYYSISISPDGNTLYFVYREVGKRMAAFDIRTKTIKWGFGDEVFDAPLIDSDGNLYLLAKHSQFNNNKLSLYSLNSDGSLRWSFPINETMAIEWTSPTMDKYGNIYFGYDSLYAVDYNGKLKWKIDLYQATNQNDDGYINSALVCDKNGTVYFTVGFTVHHDLYIMAVSSDGKILWKTVPPLTIGFAYSPAISSDGKLFFPSAKYRRIIAIK